MAASEQSEIAACDVIRFLAVRFLSVFFYNVKLNADIEFQKTAALEPIFCTE